LLTLRVAVTLSGDHGIMFWPSMATNQLWRDQSDYYLLLLCAGFYAAFACLTIYHKGIGSLPAWLIVLFG